MSTMAILIDGPYDRYSGVRPNKDHLPPPEVVFSPNIEYRLVGYEEIKPGQFVATYRCDDI